MTNTRRFLLVSAGLLTTAVTTAFSPLDGRIPGVGKPPPSLSTYSALEPEVLPGVRPRNVARESAVLVEWEKMTELERRVEDGVHYEHEEESMPFQTKRKGPKTTRTSPGDDDFVQGVFCGYRVTEEEYGRLKSANPDDCLSN